MSDTVTGFALLAGGFYLAVDTLYRQWRKLQQVRKEMREAKQED